MERLIAQMRADKLQKETELFKLFARKDYLEQELEDVTRRMSELKGAISQILMHAEAAKNLLEMDIKKAQPGPPQKESK